MADCNYACVNNPVDPRETAHLNIHLTHGGQQYFLDLSEYGQEVMLGHLIDAAERVTGVPFSNMRLIHKGRSLTNLCPKKILILEGVQNGAKILMIGRKPIASDHMECQQLVEIEQAIDPVIEQIHDIQYELEGIIRGFLCPPQQPEAFYNLRGRLIGIIEWFRQTLRIIDAIKIDRESTDARIRRKLIKSRIRDHLTKCDRLLKAGNQFQQELDKRPH